MSLLLDALKKAAEDKEKNKPVSSDDSVDDIAPLEENNLTLESAEGNHGDEKSDDEEDFDLELPHLEDIESVVSEPELNEPEMVEPEAEVVEAEITEPALSEKKSEVAQEIIPSTEHKVEEKVVETPAVVEAESIVPKDINSQKSEQKLPDYNNADARKVLEVSQKRYRNSQRLAYYGLYGFAALLFFSGSYLYYTAEILDNADKLTFKQENKTRYYPKTEQEKKIERQVSIAKVKLAEIDNSNMTHTADKVVAVKKVTAPVKKKKIINIIKQKKADPISLLLQKAYAHYQAGEYAVADDIYKKILLRDQRQRDALLGRAAVAVINQQYVLARNQYQQLLRFYPRDSIARSALVDLAKQEVSVANESQLNLLLRQNPNAAHVHFSLGLLYAKKGDIKLSQQAFFDAYALDKKADYAFNLAVMLDKLGQPKAALSYYKQASNLSDKSSHHFNEKIALERILQLEGRDE